MSEPNPQNPTDGAPAASPPAPRRRRGVLAVVAVVALLVGGTAAAFLLYDRINMPEYTFKVIVFLEADVTTAQKDALRAALDGIDTLDGVRYESREQAYENFKELYEDSPDLVESVRPDTLPELFRFETKGKNTNFDCGILDPVKDLRGIDEISILRVSRDDKDNPVKKLTCP